MPGGQFFELELCEIHGRPWSMDICICIRIIELLNQGAIFIYLLVILHGFGVLLKTITPGNPLPVPLSAEVLHQGPSCLLCARLPR